MVIFYIYIFFFIGGVNDFDILLFDFIKRILFFGVSFLILFDELDDCESLSDEVLFTGESNPDDIGVLLFNGDFFFGKYNFDSLLYTFFLINIFIFPSFGVIGNFFSDCGDFGISIDNFLCIIFFPFLYHKIYINFIILTYLYIILIKIEIYKLYLTTCKKKKIV